MGHNRNTRRWVMAGVATAGAAFVLAQMVAFTAQAEVRGFGLTGFSEISVGSGLEMVVVAGPAYSITMEGEARAIDSVDIHLEGAMLVVDRKRSWRSTWSGDQQRVLLSVTMPMVSALEAQAGAHIEISGDISQPLQAIASAGAALGLKGLHGADVTIIASGGASVVASGTCAALQAEASGGASIQAAALACGAVTADAMSGASVVVNGEEALSLGAFGGGSVFAHGAGEITREDINSGGSITVKR